MGVNESLFSVRVNSSYRCNAQEQLKLDIDGQLENSFVSLSNFQVEAFRTQTNDKFNSGKYSLYIFIKIYRLAKTRIKRNSGLIKLYSFKNLTIETQFLVIVNLFMSLRLTINNLNFLNWNCKDSIES